MSLSRHLLDPSPNSAAPSPSYLPFKALSPEALPNAPSQAALSFEFKPPHSVGGHTPSLALPTAAELWSNRNSNSRVPDLLERVPYGFNLNERFVPPSRLGNEFDSLPSKAQIGLRSRSVREWNPIKSDEPQMLHSRSADERLPSSSGLEMVSRSELPKSSSQDVTKVSMGQQISLKNNSGAVGSGSLRSKVRSNSQSSIELRSGSLTGSGRRDPDRRVVYINNPEQTNERYEFSGNTVRTSKYTLVSFVPRNLFEQFHRVAYIYFLIIALLNQLPQLAVFGRTASLFPLIFVLVVTALKDGFEDWRRHRSDKKENDRLALVAQEGEFKPEIWKHIQVGQMVKVHANETIPCDMVLVATSDENGVAYVQTINLDGESNLKSRYALPETAAKRPDLGPISGRIICEKPNRNIYGFVGYMDFEKQKLPLGPTNVILRGCELKNTSWAVGVVVYAGQETKAMLNSSGAQSKRSRLEQSMNREMLWLSVFLFVICFVGALGLYLWLKRHKGQLNTLPYYHKYNTSTGKDYNYYGVFGESFFAFLSFVITFQVMIPISLYISLELVRLGQSVFMIRDAEMYHSDSNTRLQCRALSINEDLGQIKYIFSDKTGTLTENKMEFCNASIHGVSYSNAKASAVSCGDAEGFLKQEDKHIIKEVLGKQIWKPKVEVKVDAELVRVLQDSCDTSERKAVHDYLLALAACNTVVPTKVKLTATGNLEMEVACAGAADDGIGLIEYQGESPDEQALVSAAASYGYTLLERSPNHIVIDVLGEIQRFQILGIHEFDSIRKCMSVVLQCPDRTIKVLVKGADSSVFSKLAQLTEADGETFPEENQQTQLLFATRTHLDHYARQGLRTFVVAAKDLRGAELEDWKSHYTKANTTLHDRGSMLQEAAKIVEKGLSLLGATGIEDRLQGGVPETLKALRQAGIKVWVLTGDKQETAISIGFSCSLLTADMHQIIINESERESCHDALINAKAAYVSKLERRKSLLKRKCSVDVTYGENHQGVSTSGDEFSSASTSLAAVDSTSLDCAPLKRSVASCNTSQPLALIIDGNSLVHALDPDLQQEFYDLASVCKAVICCRVAPLQKAGIVSLVKIKSRDMTLAIGDGANDVSMIQTADVGIGISGQEGRQAVLASDFAMGQFRFLKRLLLVHGHWNYSRIGYMVLYNFYRNAVFVMMLFWYIFHNAFSPLSAITDWSLVFYSLIYTASPTIVVGVLDKDVSHKTLLEYPDLYTVGQRDGSYNATLFWFTMLDTLWQSLVLFYVPFFTYRNSTIDIWGIGSIWTIAVVILVNLHLAMDIRHWTWIIHSTVWGSIASTYVCLLILDIIQEEDFLPHYWVFFHVIRMAGYWLDILLIVCLALLPRFLMQIVKQHFWPSDVQVAREAEILKKNKGREELPVELDSIMFSRDS